MINYNSDQQKMLYRKQEVILKAVFQQHEITVKQYNVDEIQILEKHLALGVKDIVAVSAEMLTRLVLLSGNVYIVSGRAEIMKETEFHLGHSLVINS